MAAVCERAISMFAAMDVFTVNSVTELQKCIEQEMLNGTAILLQKKISENIDVRKRKYGVSAQLLGPLGYYHPSRIREIVCTNVKRGRVLRGMPSNPVFIYDFDEKGGVARITNVDLRMETNIIHQNAWDVCVSLHQETHEIEHVMLILNGENAHPQRWIQFYWHNNMKRVGGVAIEIYQDMLTNGICTRIDGVSYEPGVFSGLAIKDYSLLYDAEGRVIDAW